MGSQSTLCRLENRIDRRVTVDIHKLLLEQFIAAYDEPPDELILDFDATDDPVHGNQVGRFLHGYYDHYCFLLSSSYPYQSLSFDVAARLRPG